MDRINGANTIDIGGGKRGWRVQNKAAGISGTEMTAAWQNGVQEEIMAVIEAAGLTPSDASWTQLRDAIIKLRGRTRLTADTYFYVAPSGNDTTGDGLGWATCWATIQGAVNKIARLYDLAGYTATLAVGAGTYTGSIIVPDVLGGPLIILGNTTTPSSTVISTSGDNISAVGSRVSVAGLKFVSSAGSALRAYRGGQIEVSGKVDFGACSLAHMYAINSGSRIILSAGYNITGGAQNHLLSWYGLGEISTSGGALTVTLTGTPAFSGAFAWAANGCVIRVPSMTFSGAATGTRYGGSSNGIIDTAGGGANYFPGNAAGAISGGLYL